MEDKRTNVIASECQFASLKTIAEGNAKSPPKSLTRSLVLTIRRHLNPSQDRMLHKHANALMERMSTIGSKNSPSADPAALAATTHLKAGDLVRVRSKEEIEATLNHLGQSKGCSFMAEMLPFCGTVHRVLKPMERFVDERDLRVKKCKGLITLEGVMCEGTTIFGRCDRSCFMFWREEWLERIEG